MLLRGQNLLGYNHYPTEIVQDFIKAAIKNGIDIIRIFDALNDIENIKDAVKATLEFGGHPSCAICYTVSPVHNVKKFVEIAKEMEELGASSICIKDMSGCLMPNIAFDLVKELKKVLKVPVILHTHNTCGLAQMTCLKAIEAGIDVIDTAISSFSGGTSLAPTETMALTAINMGKEISLDMNRISIINNHFKQVFKKMFEDNIIDYHSLQTDTRCLVSQIPGGMYSNLLSQMKEQGILDRMDDLMDEIPLVRKELGYPPLVTPISQIVGTQAVANLIAGERYKIVINEIKAYVEGQYGKTPAPIDINIKKCFSCDTSNIRKADNYLIEKKKCLEEGYNQEDTLIRVMFPQLADKFFSKNELYDDGTFIFECHQNTEKENIKNVRPIILNDENEILYALFTAIISYCNCVNIKDIRIKNISIYN
ncbi:MAG: pyruvate carboxylase subunit B, partial [Christensenellaceae bacterium]|nr:pyruvate carboxylase subunit B [Christensenellaceae bacterium]